MKISLIAILIASIGAAHAVGLGLGDDYFWLDENRLGVVIGDVSGKGVPAALLMAVTRSLLRAEALRGDEPGLCLEEVNRLLMRDTAVDRFVTLFYAVFDGERDELCFANAGHNAPFLLRASGAVEELSGTQLVLGAIPEARYSTRTTRLQCGDKLLLYTDGVTEALNPQREQFSEQRLKHLLSEVADDRPQELIDRIVQTVRGFAAAAPQSDDITILAALYRGQCRRPEGQSP